jgi:hypothetical protein
LDEPTTLPEGTVLDLVLDDEGDDLSDQDREALHLLRASRYRVHYVVHTEFVAILAVWHSQRGQMPRL